MSLDEKIIKVHLESIENADYMIFNFDNRKNVCMNDENCQTELKAVFTELLQELLKYPVKLEYEAKSEFKKALYIDVCTEYVKELNRELSNVKKTLPKKLEMMK